MDRKQFGFLRSVRSIASDVVFGPPTLGALLVGVGGGWGLLAYTHAQTRHGIASDFLVVLGPLLGVVVAAFALVIGMFSDRYLRLLQHGRSGVLGFLRPFVIAIGIQVGTLIMTIAYRAAGEIVPSRVEVGFWLAVCFLFVYSMLDVVELAKAILAHGVTRAEDLTTADDAEDTGTVVQHPMAANKRR